MDIMDLVLTGILGVVGVIIIASAIATTNAAAVGTLPFLVMGFIPVLVAVALLKMFAK